MEKPIENLKKYVMISSTIAISLLAVFLLAESINQFKLLPTVGDNSSPNVITVSGTGEMYAVPDVATISFSVQKDAKTVSDAQTANTAVINRTIAFLKANSVEEKDIQTTDYSVSPKYEYKQPVCMNNYCPPSTQILVGYYVNQSITVKIRDITKAGDILTGIGATGVNNVSGLSFIVDKQNEIQREARELAITDAKNQAEKLASDLGVKLGKLISFNEQGNYPYPVYEKTYALNASGMGASAPAPAIPAGQNKITSNVSLTYEIR